MVARNSKKFKTSKAAAVAALGGSTDTEQAEPMGPVTITRSDGSQLEIPENRRKLVTRWQDNIRADKKYFDEVFKRMLEDMEYARLGQDKKWVESGNYTVPITNRFINQAVSALYAKNPKAVAKRRPKLMYKLWDGTQATAKAAFANMQANPQDQESAAILQEVQAAKTYDQMLERAGRTLEILFQYFTGEDFPDFKKQMKANVRRAKTTGVGYTEVGYHRAMEADPDITARIGDMTSKLERIKSLQADKAEGLLENEPEKLEELEQMLVTLEAEKMKIVTEGLMFDFPRSTDIIPHKACTQLAGFIGCDYVTREYQKTPDDIEDYFKVDVRNNYKVYVDGKATSDAGGSEKEGDRGATDSDDAGMGQKQSSKNYKGKATLWRVFDKKRREVFWLCEGYPDYLREPAPPEVQVKGFWTIFPLIFNDVEDEKAVFPPSDVHFLKHPQREFNSIRQGKREHRRANRPKYFYKSGILEEEDRKNLETAPAFACIPLKAIEGNAKIDDLIQAYKGAPIDPNLYETESVMKDILFGVGAQSADMGQTGDATATESSIAEQSRASTLSSNVDDLDEHLSEIASASAQVMLEQMDISTVVEIVGPGAVWPQLDAQTIAKELFLEVKAGSSGRPNQAAELANLERAMQFLVQLGGVSGPVLARKLAVLTDIDEDELIVEGMPSITALNAMAAQQNQVQGQAALNQQTAGHQAILGQQDAAHQAAQTKVEAAAQPQPATGNPATNPAEQGAHGAQNMAQPAGVTPQGQPAYTPPVHKYNAQGARLH